MVSKPAAAPDAAPAGRPKLLFVGGFPPPGTQVYGGQVTACRTLMESSFPEMFEVIELDSTQLTNPPPGLIVRGIHAARRLARFIWLLISARPDAVLLFAGVGASLMEKGAMAGIARLFGRAVLFFPRGAEAIETAARSPWRGFLIRAALRPATYFLCQGPAWHAFATDVMGFPAERAPIIPNWTATERLLAIGDRRTRRDSKEPPRLLFLGWLEEAKGIFELLDALEILHPDRAFKVVIAGRGHVEEEARQRVVGAGLEDSVRFVGWVGGEELETLLEQSDIFVLPTWAEGLPNAMIEAMAARLAVVISAVGNIPGLVTNDKNALLVPPRQSEPLAKAIARLLDDPALLERIALGGHSLARELFSVTSAVERLSKAIPDAIAVQRGHA